MILSIVVPCFNEEESIIDFYNELVSNLNNLENDLVSKNFDSSILDDFKYEIIFINDGSNDNTLLKIKELSLNDENIRYVSFSRNFGKESAIYCGLEKSIGDYVIVIDADLQDPPSLIAEMLRISIQSDYDVVASRRVDRKGEPVFRSFFAILFYKLINRVSDINLVDGARDFRLMTRQVVDSILELKEYNRFSKGIFNWVGFNVYWIEHENVKRLKGETSWSFVSLFKYSIEGIVAFTTVPLSISTLLGILFSLIAFFFILIIVLKHIFYGHAVQGWASTICAILLLGGIQLFSIGILGKYLEKTYLETKNRPIYIIKESNINDDDKN